MLHHSNKMIYQPPKYHSFTHFLQLNNRMTASEDDSPNDNEMINDQNSNDESNTSIEVANESAGKSFTIAAILGLKKSTANTAQNHHNHDEGDYNNQDFPSIINLATHSKLFQKFDADNRHNYNMLAEHSTQENCIYDNNTTNSTSSYQEHLHKQQQQHLTNAQQTNAGEFNVINYNREERNHHQHTLHTSANNFINKAFNRDRNRIENHFTNKTKSSSSISLKNKRVRTIFTPEQLERLEAEFERQQYMVGPERLYLAHTLQLTEAQVKVWFQNRRIKSRKQHFEMSQHHLAIARQRQQQNPISSKDESTHSDEHVVSDVDD